MRSFSYENGTKLSGVIYMHGISDHCLTGIDSGSFSRFWKLCGEEALCNVLFVTTMWSDVDPEDGALRELELKTDDTLLKPAMDGGAQMVRHDNTLSSAQAILRMLFDTSPQPLRIQREIVDEKKDIIETAAGEEFDCQLAAVVKKHKQEIIAIREEVAEALAEHDTERTQELYQSERKRRDEVNKIEQERDVLSWQFAEARRNIEEALKKEQERLLGDPEFAQSTATLQACMLHAVVGAGRGVGGHMVGDLHKNQCPYRI